MLKENKLVRRMLAVLLLAGLLQRGLASPAMGQATQTTYLSGTDAASPVEWDFMVTAGRRAGEWATLPVPSQWDMQGFGTLDYGHDRPQRIREQGLYRHSFKTPDIAEGHRTFLVFGGVMTDTQPTLNGKLVGPAHRGGFTEIRYDVTDLLAPPGRDNRLEVLVAKESEDTTINDAERRADYWIFGGIYRPVWLETVPADFIREVAIDAAASGDFQASIKLDLAMANATAVSVDILDPSGNVLATGRNELNGDDPATLQTNVEDVLPWSAESPTLYIARFQLLDGDRVVHERDERFGFRTIELRKGDGLFVNGQRVTFKGINRHSFRSASGRALSVEQNYEDARLIKAMNANAVRMSHYPPDRAFLDAADEIGLYVIDELPGWQNAYSTFAGRPLVREMVTRDRNHPSIIFWSNGNEGGWNDELDEAFAQWDLQKRPLLHTFPKFWNGRTAFRGVNTWHYQHYGELLKTLSGSDLVMPTEFLHGLYDGGHGAGLRDYWDAIIESDVGIGGFLWVFADEGTLRQNDAGEPFIDVQGNLAPDGLVGPDHKREGSFYAVADIFSPVQFGELAGDSIDVTNTFDFTNLSELEFQWTLVNFPAYDEDAIKPMVAKSGRLESPDIGPGETGKLQLGERANADAIVITAADSTGREVASTVRPIRDLRVKQKSVPQDDERSLVSGNVKLNLSDDGRTLSSVSIEGDTIPLSAGPRLALDDTAAGELVDVRWSAGEDGWFKLDYAYEATGPATFAGITFDLPAETVTASRWLGEGPFRVWQNRLEGGRLGVHELDANDTITGYRDWIYPEFRGFFAGVRWMTLSLDTGRRVTIAPQDPSVYLKRFNPSLAPQDLQMSTAMKLPDGDISLMHVIPAIGTKFTPAAELGPQSQPRDLRGQYEGTVWFRFE